MLSSELDRRRFLLAAVFFAGSTQALRSARVWAQAADTADESTRAALAAMARRLYPHDNLADAVYADILDSALAATAADGSFARTLAAAEEALNAGQREDFVDLDEARQIAAMQALEDTEFFATIQTAVRLRLYNHPAFWALIGYEGPSWQRGGYLNRGAGEIDWLPEGE